MNHLVISFCFVIIAAGYAFATNNITYFLDGTLIKREAVAVKGVINLTLPDSLIGQTLSVVPASGTSIIGVKNYVSDSIVSYNKSQESMNEQRLRLKDRLEALDTREAIFTAAAKSQSGKAPRKTKSNPDPMKAIRQGTDYAIAQLEAVYTSRRRTNQEIKKIDALLGASFKNRVKAANSLKINVTPPNGRVTVSYATAVVGWQPQYNLRLTGAESAILELYPRITGNEPGYMIFVSPDKVDGSSTKEIFKVSTNEAVLLTLHLPINNIKYDDGIFRHFSGVITNNSKRYLPPGESGFYRNGAYLGKFRFEGVSSGQNRVITLDK